jgi:hypothetical protein
MNTSRPQNKVGELFLCQNKIIPKMFISLFFVLTKDWLIGRGNKQSDQALVHSGRSLEHSNGRSQGLSRTLVPISISIYSFVFLHNSNQVRELESNSS